MNKFLRLFVCLLFFFSSSRRNCWLMMVSDETILFACFFKFCLFVRLIAISRRVLHLTASSVDYVFSLFRDWDLIVWVMSDRVWWSVWWSVWWTVTLNDWGGYGMWNNSWGNWIRGKTIQRDIQLVWTIRSIDNKHLPAWWTTGAATYGAWCTTGVIDCEI